MRIYSIIFMFIFTVLLSVQSGCTFAQKCVDFYKSGSCLIETNNRYKLSSISRGYYLQVGKTVTYEVVLYGGVEILIQCCTQDKFYPVRFKLKSSENGNIIYDNKYNKYIDNLNLLLDHTELIAIEISLEPKKKTKESGACIGMAIYIEN